MEQRWTRDISEGGLRVETAAFKDDSEVKIFVPIPVGDRGKSRMCLLHAKVVLRRDGESGLAFLNPPAESVEAIAAYVRRQP